MERSVKWLFYCCVIYLLVGFFDMFVYRFCRVEYIQAVWVVTLSLPLYVKPLARKLHMTCIWG